MANQLLCSTQSTQSSIASRCLIAESPQITFAKPEKKNAAGVKGRNTQKLSVFLSVSRFVEGFESFLLNFSENSGFWRSTFFHVLSDGFLLKDLIRFSFSLAGIFCSQPPSAHRCLVVKTMQSVASLQRKCRSHVLHTCASACRRTKECWKGPADIAG